MAKRLAVEPDAEGGATLRVRLGPAIWGLIQRYANKLQIPEEFAARAFLGQLDALLDAGHVSWLSADWQQLAKITAASKPAVADPNFDPTKLHQSTRTKSGYVGVYANGQGFRATGPRGAYLGTYDSAEAAAWERYCYYKKNDLPYGRLEEDIERLRRTEQGTDEELRKRALELAEQTGTRHLYEEGEGPAEPATPQLLGFGDSRALEEARAALKAKDAERKNDG